MTQAVVINKMRKLQQLLRTTNDIKTFRMRIHLRIGNSLSGSSGSIGTVSSSVYGYGGLPIAPPPSGNSANFVSTHIPPAQRAGPYIPYYPQAIKPS